jgi:hypothetical protein
MEAEVMSKFSKTAKTAFCTADEAPVSDATSAPEFAIKPGTIRYRNHETLTARGWLAHRKSWPKDQHAKHSVAITYGANRILIVAPLARYRLRS